MEKVLEIIRQVLLKNYGLEIITVEKSSVGAGSDTWFVTCKDGKYVMKSPSESEINNPKQEPQLCEYLNQNGIPVCQFVKNKNGDYLSSDNSGRTFHVQKFIEGQVYDWHAAPKWLIMESAQMLGKIHTALKEYSGLPIGIGSDFFKFMTPQRALESYQNSLGIAKNQNDETVIDDLEYRIDLMKHFPKYEFDLDRLTTQSTHGDYFISQMICGEDKINAVIDWTTACVHPVVWEIVRSYVYASPLCKAGNIDVDEFIEFVSEYCKYAELTEYDLSNMVNLFYYQISVCDYYGQYYAADADNSYIYLEQAKFSTKLMKWFEKNGEALKAELIRHIG